MPGQAGDWVQPRLRGPMTGLNGSIPETTPTSCRAKTSTCVGIGCALLVVIGSIGPWAQLYGLYSDTVLGTDAEGIYSLWAAIVGGVVLIMRFLFVRMRKPFAAVVALVSGLLSFGSTLLFLNYFSNTIDRIAPMIGVVGFRDGASCDWGFFLVVFGSLGLAASGTVVLLRSK